MAVEITDSNFVELVENSDKPVVIDFWAVWCGPCKMVAPVIDELHHDFDGKAVVGKVDVDNNAALSAKYGIMNIPTILFLKNGEVVDKHVGVATKKLLTDKLNALI